MGRGKGQKGQKWDNEKQCWYFPEGVSAIATPQKDMPKAVDGFSPEQLAQIGNLLKEQRESILSETRQGNSNFIDTSRSQPIDRSEIPESDLLEKPKKYFRLNSWASFDSYLDRGKVIKAPYTDKEGHTLPIIFKNIPPDAIIDQETGYRKETRKCMAEIWSKKECAFIENSLLFLTGDICLKESDLNKMNSQSTMLRSSVISRISKMTETDIAIECKGRQITPKGDFNANRKALIESLCRDIAGEKRSISESIAGANANNDKVLLG